MTEQELKIITAYEKTLAVRMAVVWVVLFTLASFCNATVTAFYGLKWEQMSLQDWVMICLLIFANWATVIMAFLSKAMTRAMSGQFPLGNGDTEILRRSRSDHG